MTRVISSLALRVSVAIRPVVHSSSDFPFAAKVVRLARYARQAVAEFSGGEPFVPDDAAWYGSMATVPLPNVPRSDAGPDKPHPVQIALWGRFQIEVPIFEWRGRLCLRVSGHLYNRPEDVDRLLDALRQLAS